jgi:hypothetical protein
VTDLHARLVEEIKRRRTLERSEELLRIAELHEPKDGFCMTCDEYAGDEWPCNTAKELLDYYVPGWRKPCQACSGTGASRQYDHTGTAAVDAPCPECGGRKSS